METPVVQFSASIQYAHEGSVANIQVMRIGALDKTCVVRYMPASDELEGTKFHPCRGELEFGPGDDTKTFDLRLTDERTFTPVVEIPFRLEAVSNCEVGKYNHMTRIKVIDSDVFPSEKFKAEILADPSCETWKGDKDWSMLWEVVKYCFRIHPWGATKILLGDQIINVVFIAQLELGKTLINALSDTEHWFHTREGILLIAIALTAPYALNHWFAYRKEFWKVGGRVRQEMWNALVTRILYYEESSRDTINTKEVQETFSHHAFAIVSDGYMQVFPLVASLGRVVVVLMYFLYSATIYFVEKHRGDMFFFMIFFAVVPLAAWRYMKLRGRQSNVVRDEVVYARITLAHFLDRVVGHHRVIADSWARPIAIAKCSDLIQKVNKSLVVQGARQANDIAFFGWGTELVEACTIILGGILVLEGLSLGAFTSTLAGLRSATGQYAMMYQAAQKMQSIFSGQWLLCQYMNRPMDLAQREDIAATRRTLWRLKLEQAYTDQRVQRREQVAEDVVPLQLVDVTFRFPRNLKSHLCMANSRISSVSRSSLFQSLPPDGEQLDAAVLKDITLSIEQGKLIGITGPPGDGKATLLKVLAEVLLPSSGTIFIPSHLLVHHLELRDFLYQGSIAENVYFALMARRGTDRVEDLSQRDLDRGVTVCQALGMSENIIEAVQDYSTHTGTSLQGLSRTTKIKVQLARALVANPEALVVHFPADVLNAGDADIVMQQLRDFVRNKGVNMDPEGFSQRRPRTCIFTSSKESLLKQWPDKVFSVVKGRLLEGIRGVHGSAAAETLPESGWSPDLERPPECFDTEQRVGSGSHPALVSEPVDAEHADRSQATDGLVEFEECARLPRDAEHAVWSHVTDALVVIEECARLPRDIECTLVEFEKNATSSHGRRGFLQVLSDVQANDD